MAENKNDFASTVEALFKGMDNFITTKTVVGDAITMEDTIVLPLVDVSFGVGAGAMEESGKKNSGGGALGGKIQPSAVLVIKDGNTRLVNVKNQEGLTKILDFIPDIMNKFKKDEGKDSVSTENAEVPMDVNIQADEVIIADLKKDE